MGRRRNGEHSDAQHTVHASSLMEPCHSVRSRRRERGLPVWEGAFCAMLIVVRDGAAFVNGRRAEPISETVSGLTETGEGR